MFFDRDAAGLIELNAELRPAELNSTYGISIDFDGVTVNFAVTPDTPARSSEDLVVLLSSVGLKELPPDGTDIAVRCASDFRKLRSYRRYADIVAAVRKEYEGFDTRARSFLAPLTATPTSALRLVGRAASHPTALPWRTT